MIDLTTTVAKQPATGIVPKGDYKVTVLEIGAWTPHVKDIMANKTDSRGRLVRGADGKPIKEMLKNHTFYTADVVLIIQGTDYDGAKLYTSLTTHPNAYFITENFVRAVGLVGTPLKDVITAALDKDLTVTVDHDSYEKKSTDPDTGLEIVENKLKAKVIAFK